MSAQSDLIDFFRLNATFDPTTRSTREVIRSSDRAQLKRQIVTVKEWKRQVEPIGNGGSGIIWLEHDEDGQGRVVKQIFKATPTTSPQTDYKRELQALGRLSKHQDLFVHFYGWFENDTSIFLTMEYFELGDLEKFITPKLTEKDAKVIGRQLLEGLQVLHGYRLAHRDLKPANILVARCAPDWWIKLGDFGILRGICTAHNSRLTCIGTPDYMAPEMLLDNDNEDRDSPYTLAVDIWSLGCVLFRLLTHRFPFPELRHLRLYWRSGRPFPTDILIKYGVSDDGVSFITEIMKSNPADRMTVAMALLHSWVSIHSIQESTPALGDLGSFKDSVEDELDGKSVNKGFATKSPITSHTRNRDIPHENEEDLPSHSQLASSQNEEMLQLCNPMPDKEERILDSSDKDPDILESKSNLANSYIELGQYKEAMQLFQEIIEARQRLLGDEHPDTLRVMNDLAKSFTKLGRYQEAMHLYKQTLEFLKRILGDEHPDTLQSMSGLAVSYHTLGQYQEAIHLSKQTLELRKRILGDEHPDTLWSMNDLAISYFTLGQYQEAMHLFKQTLELRKRILGDEHHDTFQSMFGLAASYFNLGRYQEAIHLEEQTLKLRKRILGDEHPDTLWSMNSLAIFYSRLGQNQEAIYLQEQTLELRKRILGDEHPDTLQSMNGLAVSYSNLGQYQKGIYLKKQTLELQKRILGDEHPNTLWSMNSLASSYSNLGQDQEAMHLRKKTLELRKRILGDEHPDTLWSMSGLAVIYSNLRQHQEAMHLRKQTLELRKRILGDKHPDTLQSMIYLAKSYYNLGQYQEATDLRKQLLELQTLG